MPRATYSSAELLPTRQLLCHGELHGPTSAKRSSHNNMTCNNAERYIMGVCIWLWTLVVTKASPECGIYFTSTATYRNVIHDCNFAWSVREIEPCIQLTRCQPLCVANMWKKLTFATIWLYTQYSMHRLRTKKMKIYCRISTDITTKVSQLSGYFCL